MYSVRAISFPKTKRDHGNTDKATLIGVLDGFIVYESIELKRDIENKFCFVKLYDKIFGESLLDIEWYTGADSSVYGELKELKEADPYRLVYKLEELKTSHSLTKINCSFEIKIVDD